MVKRTLKPTHPGEVLMEEFLKPFGITQYRLAKSIAVPQIRISKIVNGERGITPDTALRLSRYFGVSAEFWMNLQTSYELKLARKEIGRSIDSQVIPLDDAA